MTIHATLEIARIFAPALIAAACAKSDQTVLHFPHCNGTQKAGGSTLPHYEIWEYC